MANFSVSRSQLRGQTIDSKTTKVVIISLATPVSLYSSRLVQTWKKITILLPKINLTVYEGWTHAKIAMVNKPGTFVSSCFYTKENKL